MKIHREGRLDGHKEIDREGQMGSEWTQLTGYIRYVTLSRITMLTTRSILDTF